MTFEVVMPERRVLSATVDEVVLPGKMGYFGVLPGHAPFLTSLSIGLITYRIGERSHYIAVSWGFCEVLYDKVIVLAETAEKAEEIDLQRALDKKQQAEEILRLKKGDLEFKTAEIRLRKALARIEAHGKL
ncbi:MAG: F0F1 ATP synthase subunit epsilon [Acidobacteriota bacterium]